jgi:hypothetical protein
MAGRATLVKSVLTVIVIYYITVLNVSIEILMKIDSIRRAFLWASCDKVTGGNSKLIGKWCASLRIVEGLGSSTSQNLLRPFV